MSWRQVCGIEPVTSLTQARQPNHQNRFQLYIYFSLFLLSLSCHIAVLMLWLGLHQNKPKK